MQAAYAYIAIMLDDGNDRDSKPLGHSSTSETAQACEEVNTALIEERDRLLTYTHVLVRHSPARASDQLSTEEVVKCV